jgi:flavin-dependent dehydrogenase
VIWVSLAILMVREIAVNMIAGQKTGRPESISALNLHVDSRVAVMGGGPAGSFFSFFLLDIAQRMDLGLTLDIYEPKKFSDPGCGGCNMCGGIISESLVQMLAVEGILLPPTVVQRGIDSYVLHTNEGDVSIETPLHEKRIAAIHRGGGPRGIKGSKWRSFDGFLLEQAVNKGAHLVAERVEDVAWTAEHPQVKTATGWSEPYDLLVVAAGVNSAALKLFEKLDLGYKPPRTTKTYISELYLGGEELAKHLGNSMHVFLLDLPNLEFAALIPKGDYVTLCLLGRNVDSSLVQSLLNAPELKKCLPSNWQLPESYCHCSPRINVRGATQPFADRLVFVGDSGVARLYKDGIGSAYRTAKAAAMTALFQGVSAKDFRRHYWPVCRAIRRDNNIGKLIFAITGQQQKRRHDRIGILRMVAREQRQRKGMRRMSVVMWDMFTGSASYLEVLLCTLHPGFWGRLIWEVCAGLFVGTGSLNEEYTKERQIS